MKIINSPTFKQNVRWLIALENLIAKMQVSSSFEACAAKRKTFCKIFEVIIPKRRIGGQGFANPSFGMTMTKVSKDVFAACNSILVFQPSSLESFRLCTESLHCDGLAMVPNPHAVRPSLENSSWL